MSSRGTPRGHLSLISSELIVGGVLIRIFDADGVCAFFDADLADGRVGGSSFTSATARPRALLSIPKSMAGVSAFFAAPVAFDFFRCNSSAESCSDAFLARTLPDSGFVIFIGGAGHLLRLSKDDDAVLAALDGPVLRAVALARSRAGVPLSGWRDETMVAILSCTLDGAMCKARQADLFG